MMVGDGLPLHRVDLLEFDLIAPEVRHMLQDLARLARRQKPAACHAMFENEAPVAQQKG